MGTKSIDYIPQGGVCSKLIRLTVEDGKVTEASFIGGCHGNTQGVCALIKGMSVDEVISRLKGIDCKGKELHVLINS